MNSVRNSCLVQHLPKSYKNLFNSGCRIQKASFSVFSVLRNASNKKRETNEKEIMLEGKAFTLSSKSNITPTISSKLSKKLYNVPNHPIKMIKDRIELYFKETLPKMDCNSPTYAIIDNLSPIVSLYQNFDSLLVPENHVTRSPNDTYYVNDSHVLRCHTSAHQSEVMKAGHKAALITGDVYRRDEIDASHYPVFHQMEGLRLLDAEDLSVYHGKKLSTSDLFDASGLDAPAFSDITLSNSVKQPHHTDLICQLVEQDLKNTLNGLVRFLFGANAQIRWIDAYFPFTHPSWEVEVFFQDRWLEVLGSGVIQQPIVSKAGVKDRVGWAFGLGLERLAMVLYSIPDIRLFWSSDPRFIEQFDEKSNALVTFKPFSKYPSCYQDVSLWLSPQFTDNNFFELVRSVGGDSIEKVEMIDEFTHPKSKKTSKCFRITFCSLEKTLTMPEVTELRNQIWERAEKELGVEIRKL